MSRDNDADVAFIRALAEVLREHDLAEVEVAREYGEDDELKVRLARQTAQPVQHVAVAAAPAPVAPVHAAPPASAASAPTPAALAEATAPEGDAVKSPMVGTAYLAPEPGADPFIAVGDQVSEGQTLLIIEAMKTMNQIPAPKAGRIARILVANAEPVEFGAPLVVIE
ncbi:MAG: acetyl-CoA carboxylase biotin carboxyl carrier protein [Pseudomonadota bacterium]